MWLVKSTKESSGIPERLESKYCGRYERVSDVDRLIQIFQESGNLAMESRNPETAYSRYNLAIECYHQLISLRIKRRLQKSITNAMQILVEQFPSQLCVNEALGLCDRANKLNSIEKQYECLKEAKFILEQGLEKHDIGYEKIMSIYKQVVEYLQIAEDRLSCL